MAGICSMARYSAPLACEIAASQSRAVLVSSSARSRSRSPAAFPLRPRAAPHRCARHRAAIPDCGGTPRHQLQRGACGGPVHRHDLRRWPERKADAGAARYPGRASHPRDLFRHRQKCRARIRRSCSGPRARATKSPITAGRILLSAKCRTTGCGREMQKTDDAIRAAIGKRPVLMRPPYGSITARQKKWIHAEFGYRTILWDVDPLDWKRPGPARRDQSHREGNARRVDRSVARYPSRDDQGDAGDIRSACRRRDSSSSPSQN